MKDKYIFEFEGIDFWSRPVFKHTKSEVRIGAIDKLCDANFRESEDLVNYFTKNKEELTIFGTTFDEHDPEGLKLKQEVINNMILKP